MTNSIFKSEDIKNNDGTRTYIIYKNREWNASFKSLINESYIGFMNRISDDVKKQTSGQINTKW